MPYNLKPIKPKRISDQVFEQLKEAILRGQFKPGQQLTPERELATALQVSRTTIREAINMLVAMGLLEQKQGQGTFVCVQDARRNALFFPEPAASDEITIGGLLEVRLGLECRAAALAAERADQRDIRFLENGLADLRKTIGNGRLGTNADVAFHMAIAYATKNPVQVQLMWHFYDLFFNGVEAGLRLSTKRDDQIVAGIEQHEAIFKAIRTHDPQQAHAAMHDHIVYVRNLFNHQVATSR